MSHLIMLGVAAIIILTMWLIYTRRMLKMMQESISNAMCQIGVQLSSRWDALSALLDTIKCYDESDYNALFEMVKARRAVTAESSPREAAEQENLLTGATNLVAAAADFHPALKTNPHYQKTMNLLNQYEGMTSQSRLVYNDSVTRINRQLRSFPTSLLAGIIGFDEQTYLMQADQNNIHAMP